MQEHYTGVQHNISTVVEMYKERCSNTETEDHLIAMAEREIGGINKDLLRLEKLQQELNEKTFKYEASMQSFIHTFCKEYHLHEENGSSQHTRGVASRYKSLG